MTGDCEFYCYEKGFNTSFSGLFAKDMQGNIFLLHKGKAGGNTAYATIDEFCKYYETAERQRVLVNNIFYDFFIISDIDSTELFKNIMNYAEAIRGFKNKLKT